MFRYIDMPKLVAFYLREFSVRADGTPSDLYKFVFCLCLPFISKTFRRARINALAIAECANSGDQIVRVLAKLTGSHIELFSVSDPYFVSYNATSDDDPVFAYGATLDEDPIVPYAAPNFNEEYILIVPNGVPESVIEGYISLLVPFYVKVTIIYKYDE